MQEIHQSIQDLIDANSIHEKSTIRQYAKSMVLICDFFGEDEIARQEIEADLSDYLAFAPKFTKSNTKLRAAIAVKGWSENTYKQHQSNGRRLSKNSPALSMLVSNARSVPMAFITSKTAWENSLKRN